MYCVEYDIENKYVVDDDDVSDELINLDCGLIKKTNNMGIMIDGKVIGTARLFYDTNQKDWIV